MKLMMSEKGDLEWSHGLSIGQVSREGAASDLRVSPQIPRHDVNYDL